MSDLFRFVVLRAAQSVDAVTVPLDGDTALHTALAADRRSDRPRESMVKAAEAFTRSDTFVTDIASLALAGPLTAFARAVDAEHAPDLAGITALAEQYLGGTPAAVVASAEFAAENGRVSDTLVASKLAPDGATSVAGELIDIARTMHLLRRIADGDPSLDRAGAVDSARTALLTMSPDIVPPDPAAVSTPPAPPNPGPDQGALVEQAVQLRAAILAVRGAEPNVVTAASAEPHDRVSADALATRFATFARSDLNTPRVAEVHDEHTALAEVPVEARRTLELHAGVGADASAPQSLEILHAALSSTVTQLDRRYLNRLPDFHLLPVTEPGIHDEATDPAPVRMTALPVTHGTITAAGIADLLVTRQHTVRYEPGEIAHIENVARNETMSREIRRLDSTETTTVHETEVTTTDERDLQSTDRFDLDQSTDQIVHSDNARIPGQPSSDSYGALVESARGQQNSQHTAETHGRDVTSRAATTITTRTRTSLTQQVLHKLEDRATHAYGPSGTDDSIVYQWLDRIVSAQVYSYGKRLMYDIVVPEPAAFLAQALTSHPFDEPLPPKPAPFTLDPTLLNEWNWSYYVAGYGATGVSPPPPPTVTAARTFTGLAQNIFSDSSELRSTLLSTGTTVAIPDGYQATKATVRLGWGGWEGASQDLDVVIGARRVAFNWGSPPIVRTDLDGETGEVPLTARLDGGIYSYAIAIEISCTVTAERYAEWQVSTHAAILAAAQTRLADYESRLAQVRAGLQLMSAGQSPARKAELERDELHKACLAVISNQQFDGFSAVEHSPQGFPQPYLPNVELYGRYLRFLENAFEWDQMTWRYSPYFWGRKPYWIQAVLRDDPDPAFTDFLTAGAARVLLPVRPGFEAAVADFMQTGAVPTSVALEDVVGPLYLPLLQELREPDSALDGGTPYSAAWEVRLPTTLVVLRRDPTLPHWKQQKGADGLMQWVPTTGDPLL